MKLGKFPMKYFCLAAFIVLSLLGYFFLARVEQSSFLSIISLYTFLFLLYFLIIRGEWNNKQVQLLTVAGVLFRLFLVFQIPNLSDDYLRYNFDGRLVSAGISPYQFRPGDVQIPNLVDEGQMSDLLIEKNHFSIYPPVTQYIVGFAVFLFPQDVDGATIVMKLFIWLFEIASLCLIISLLAMFNLSKRKILLYALNPLVIFEFLGGLHFEAGMVTFTLLALWFFQKQNWILSSLALGIAIGVKLIPLFFILFLVRQYRIQKLLAYGLVSSTLFFLIFLTIGQVSYLPNFYKSLQLYFTTFEFNASIYYLFRWVGYQLTGINQIGFISPVLTVLVGISLIILAIKRISNIRGIDFINKILIGLTIYHLLATTINPWYIAPLVAFGLFTSYRYAIAWTFLIPISYIAYAGLPYVHTSIAIVIEYSVLFLVMAIDFKDLYIIRKIRELSVRFRAQIKVRRLLPLLNKDFHYLDLGSGNGGVCMILREKGYSVIPADVVDKSFFYKCKPVIYDGIKLPFEDDSFDGVLLLTMLHHTPNPKQIIEEAKRVSKRHLIVIEDVYTNNLQKWITQVSDSIVNLEFKGHPHTNKQDKEWKDLFNSLSLKIHSSNSKRFLLIFRQSTYLLQK